MKSALSGLSLPEKCLRDCNDCEPLSQIVGHNEDDSVASFICCGHNDEGSRNVPQDRFRVCFKNNSIDEKTDWDERDIKDTIAVLSRALSVDANLGFMGTNDI